MRQSIWQLTVQEVCGRGRRPYRPPTVQKEIAMCQSIHCVWRLRSGLLLPAAAAKQPAERQQQPATAGSSPLLTRRTR